MPAAAFSMIILLGWSLSASAGAELHEVARVVSVAPQWDRGPIDGLPNQSFFADTTTGLNRFEFRDELMNSKMAAEMQQRWDDLNRDYDMRKKHALATQEEHRTHMEQVKS